MNYLLTVLLFLAMCSSSFAQYERAMQAAKDFERQGEFYKAILTYNANQGFNKIVNWLMLSYL